MNVLSKPDVSMLDQYSKINNSTSRQEFIVRDNQTRQLKFSSSQKIVSYDLNFFDLKEFCIDSKRLQEYIFAKIRFGASYLVHKFITMGQMTIADTQAFSRSYELTCT